MKITGVIQARTSSKRLPNKVLLPVLERPLILHQIERIKRSKMLNQIILATSIHHTDNELFDILNKNGVNTFRGSLENVLERFYQCAKKFDSDVIVRLTGDCPLNDPDLIDEIIQFYLESNFSYVGNSIDSDKLTVPDGFDMEIFSFSILEKAYKEAKLPSEKEHVTPWMRSENSSFNWTHFEHKRKRKYYRLSVDHMKDFLLIKSIIENFSNQRTNYSIDEIIEFCDNNPSLSLSNISIPRNEGYTKSLINEELSL